MKFLIGFLVAGFFASAASSLADTAFQCEVLAVQGSVQVRTSSGGLSTVKEGDLLSEGDFLEVPEGGSLDLAYDRDWRNVVRLEGGSKAKVASISPAKLDVNEGAVYAKLRSLPSESSFEVKTPTAVAAVRGTEYRTVVVDGETEVFNFSPSKVFVYGVDPAGVKMPSPAVLEQGQKTAVEEMGKNPEMPELMDVQDKTEGERSQMAIETQIERAVGQGRAGKIQSVSEIEKALTTAKNLTRYDRESRVTDTRRRSFN